MEGGVRQERAFLQETFVAESSLPTLTSLWMCRGNKARDINGYTRLFVGTNKGFV